MYKKFRFENEAEEWFSKNYSKFLIKTHDESLELDTLGSAIFSYTGSMSKVYNDILMCINGDIDLINSVSNITFDEKQDIKILYNAFEYNTISEDIYLYHYFNKKSSKFNIKKNGIIQINKFISTTCIPNIQNLEKMSKEHNYNSVLKIRVKKGTACIPVGNNPKSLLKEYEIILKPKSKFRIINIKHNIFGKPKTEIECEVL